MYGIRYCTSTVLAPYDTIRCFATGAVVSSLTYGILQGHEGKRDFTGFGAFFGSQDRF